MPPPVQVTPEERQKREFFNIYEKVARARQAAFLATFKDINEKKKEALAKEGKLKKCCRFLGKIIMGLIFLAIVFSFARPKIYKYMGWELNTNSTIPETGQQSNYPPPPSSRRLTPEDI